MEGRKKYTIEDVNRLIEHMKETMAEIKERQDEGPLVMLVGEDFEKHVHFAKAVHELASKGVKIVICDSFENLGESLRPERLRLDKIEIPDMVSDCIVSVGKRENRSIRNEYRNRQHHHKGKL